MLSLAIRLWASNRTILNSPCEQREFRSTYRSLVGLTTVSRSSTAWAYLAGEAGFRWRVWRLNYSRGWRLLNCLLDHSWCHFLYVQICSWDLWGCQSLHGRGVHCSRPESTSICVDGTQEKGKARALLNKSHLCTVSVSCFCWAGEGCKADVALTLSAAPGHLLGISICSRVDIISYH